MTSTNSFGAQSYWNRPTKGRQKKLPSKYPAIKSKTKKAKTEATTTPPSRSPSPTASQTPSQSSNITIVSPSRSVPQMPQMSKEEENDAKDEKSIVKLMKSTLPKFSNEVDWEMAVFELGLVLDRIWPHRDSMDIMEYMQSSTHRRSYSGDMEDRADRLIYFALTSSAKKDSYAKTQILASCHKDAVPCVMKNEGKKLYQMFNSSFTMTNLHQASLPTVRAEFYSILQKENESILKYSARVDTIVSTMAKLGERVSPGAWIYALGNGLRNEYKESKDGILYSKDGYGTVMSVKTKLLSEEAVLNSKSNKDAVLHTSKGNVKDDEIAMASLKLNVPDKHKQPSTITPDDQKEQAFWLKGKGGKGNSKGKGNPKGKWQNTWNNWSPATTTSAPQYDSWAPPSPEKGKGKHQGGGVPAKGFDSQALWCDIHQKYGHSTDWCFDNPHRTGGPLLFRERCQTRPYLHHRL